MNGHRAKISTGTVPINEPPYKHINNTNIAYATSTKIEQANGQGRKRNRSQKNGIGEKVEPGGRPASLAEVQQFFKNENFRLTEAEKFYNYFQSNGWKVGGRAPMKDWHAAARNWILNAVEFKQRKASSSKGLTEKNYAEPL